MAASLQLLEHRGPDNSQIWSHDGIIIGHCRLSIIDLSSSHQPMSDPTNRYILSYNGEIYNYRSVRESLMTKWNFVTNGDTEVLLAGLILEGPEFLNCLEGMWAFVLWDNLKKVVLLARDRMGKKPLYYMKSEKTFCCASELTALKALLDCNLQEDLDSTADYFRYGYYLPGNTAFKGIKEILPGNIARWQPGGSLEHQRYWRLDFCQYAGSEKQGSIELEETLQEAAKIRLVADVEVGAFLSGGIDSSLLVGLLSQHMDRPLKTFTIGFDDKSFDEKFYAKIVADRFNTDHYEEKLCSWGMADLIELICKRCGQPFSDSSLLPTALVSRLASKHVKVAVSGDGADELFSGYQRYQARALFRWYSRVPPKFRRAARNILRKLHEPSSHHSRSVLKKIHLFLDIIDNDEKNESYIAPLIFSRKQFENMCPGFEDMGHSPPFLPDECKVDDISHMMMSDSIVYLPQDILTKVDRGSMNSSLETRSPFLDSRLVSLAFSFPISWHRTLTNGKKALRNTFKEMLPLEVWTRRKQGFSVPVYQWLQGELKHELRTMLNTMKSPLDLPYIKNEIFEKHLSGERDYSNRLWVIFVYLKWRQKNGW